MAVEQHYDGHQVAELLGLDYETVLHLAQTGEIATVRIGRLRRFPDSAVQAFLDRNRDTAMVVDLRSRVASPTNRRRS
jgi:excisionase family DNA binding protein